LIGIRGNLLAATEETGFTEQCFAGIWRNSVYGTGYGIMKTAVWHRLTYTMELGFAGTVPTAETRFFTDESGLIMEQCFTEQRLIGIGGNSVPRASLSFSRNSKPDGRKTVCFYGNRVLRAS
jgi:hypothetical protein